MVNLYSHRVVKPVVPNADDMSLLYGENVQPVDPFYAQDFALGENGVYLNEIEQTRRAQSNEVVNAILSRLSDYRVNNPNTELTDSQIIERIVPRGVQNYAEVDSYVKHQLSKVDWKARFAAYEKATGRNKPASSDVDSESSPSGAPASE